ncbi:hypothetical protein Salat_1448800 [Sesamum alatum]|uniref:Uncharacterized protein n=1 Tax=Sesamum alatum TaxID=300844 RepID=A0AAE2CLP2_9LAMI|nr:hypothetical protein Salat_1448800 [Sesamum alatum]
MSDFQNSLTTLDRSWLQEFRQRMKSNPLKYIMSDRFGQDRDRTGNNQGFHKLRLQLRHLERHHAAVAEAHHRAPLYPQLSQRFRQTLSLEGRRAVRFASGGAAEEEEVRHIDGVFFAKGEHLEWPGDDALAGEALDEYY